jgi:FkbH-like protein/FkbM family methyltransferase
VAYTFYENGQEQGVARRAARLEIEKDTFQSTAAGDGPSIHAFQELSDRMDTVHFYQRLHENGNQYGPSFQNLAAIWRAGDETLAHLSATCGDRPSEPYGVHPARLDSMIQLLAPFVMDRGSAFLLRSIDRVEVLDVNFPVALWGRATLTLPERTDGNGVAGDVTVFDESGKTYLRCSGVALTVLDGPGKQVEPTTVAIASNFTAEPVEDSLRFWADYFEFPVRLEFAPYNQLFQQLLGAGSLLRANAGGANVMLLSLEEWAAAARTPLLTLRTDGAAQCFRDYQRYVLPNGLEITHLNRYETEYLYEEIFEDRCYLRHGIHLQDGDTVVDIGANIGLFSLFVLSQCRDACIYAFEPAPVAYQRLKANCEAYGSNVTAVNAGVSDRPRTATFTFYEKSSVFSGFHADQAEDREAIRAVVRNALRDETSIDGEAAEEFVEELIADRLRSSSHECRLTSVSQIFQEYGLDRISLLKIDAERSESEILSGIEDQDWPKIAQIVIEIHDATGEAVSRIQDLLTAKGYRCAVEQQSQLERSGLFNLYATRMAAGRADRPNCSLERNLHDFRAALRAFMSQSAASLVLCICPRTPAAESDRELKQALNDAEQALLSEAGAIPNVRTISSASLLSRYRLTDYYDPESRSLGHIPYTPECFGAIGTAVARALLSLKRKPVKAIVLDCDNTLWEGTCGEDGPREVKVSAPYRALQAFMARQAETGVLLCLCSKNNEKDVLDVFEHRTDMVLKREHLAAWRINWNGKPDNIRSLAAELNLGLDSFIFIDDNGVECESVRIQCPDVLTLQLPADSGAFDSFLDHVWAFDQAPPTREDRNRTRLYHEEAGRRQLREQALSLRDFIAGLQLRAAITEATDDDLGRISQLTIRTNQFNFTTIRRSESEIRQLLRAHATCLAVRVADRFGDYGLVGVVIYEKQPDRYKVDTFLLSCRVLGRGVEHAVLAELGRRAARDNRRFVELTYRPTDRNLPAGGFIRSIGGPYGHEGGTRWTFPAEYLAKLEYQPDDRAPASDEALAESATFRRASRFGAAGESERLQRIAESLNDAGRIAMAIQEYRLSRQSRPAADAVEIGSATTLQLALMEIWKRVLGKAVIGLNDNFFEAGGTSLKAVQVIATIKKELNLNLSIVSLFECSTVALLAARLGACAGGPRAYVNTNGAAMRGRQRRANVLRRKVS